MKLLLAAVLTVLPLVAHAEPSATVAPGAFDFSLSADESMDEADALEWFQNPYRPSSPTNFEALIGSSYTHRYDPVSRLARPVEPHPSYEVSPVPELFWSATHDYSVGIFSARIVSHNPSGVTGWPIHWYYSH